MMSSRVVIVIALLWKDKIMTPNLKQAFEQITEARKALEDLRTRFHSNVWHEAFSIAFSNIEGLKDESNANKDIATIGTVYCGHIAVLINVILEESNNKISVHAFASVYTPLESARRFFKYELEDIEDAS